MSASPVTAPDAAHLLVIESATAAVAVALAGVDGRCRASASFDAGPAHAERLAPAVEWLGEQLGLALGPGHADIAAVVVDVGPGLFTGLRVGVAAAKGFALAWGLPAIGVGSLDALAWPLRHCPTPVVPVLDARRAQVYWQLPGSPAQVGEPTELAGVLAELPEPAVVVGDGAERYAELFARSGAVVAGAPERGPRVESVAALGAAALAAGGVVTAAGLSPRYLRAPDARPPVARPPVARPPGPRSPGPRSPDDRPTESAP